MQKRYVYSIILAASIAVMGMTGCQAIESLGKPKPVEFQSGQKVETESSTVTMVLQPGETEKLDELPGLMSADLRGSENYEEIFAWAQAHPEVYVRYTVPLPNGSQVTNEISALRVEDLKKDQVPELIKAIKCLPKMRELDLGAAREGFGWDEVLGVQQELPELQLSYAGELYGLPVHLSDTSLDLKYIQIDDGGELVKKVVACMPKLKFLDMDSCGLSDEEMASIRDAFPQVKVVWRVWFGDAYSVRTDVERILASKPSQGGGLHSGNTQSLKYCTDVKYLDLGHNEGLDDISFVKYMPELEVAILAMGAWSDTTPLLQCPKLEYLEIQTNPISDISGLANCTQLQHLNICNLNGPVDLSPLFGMDKLQRLWIGGYTHVDPEQVKKIQENNPDCEINTSAGDPTEGHWRYVDLNLDTWVYIQHPRYVLLRDQFGGYKDSAFAFYWNDPLCPKNFE